VTVPHSREDFIARLQREGERRYHVHHPFHRRMHAGELNKDELQRWVQNRYYYQTRIPIKDALILSKSEDSAFRRMWMRRILEQDGWAEDEGGLSQWLSLAEGVGLHRDEVAHFTRVLPGVRFACDAYVELVRQRSLLEAVASSLTELFAPELMSERIAAWRRHYPWVTAKSLGYFESRVERAKHDSTDAVGFVVENASSLELQDACVAALVRKTEVLWHLLDCVAQASPTERG
jgi:pyrroloquinoline-quinone synthase